MAAPVPFTMVRPAVIGAAQITACNIAEPDPTYDPPAWNAGTAYNIGDQASRAATHRIYQRRVAGTTAGTPETDAVNWADIGATAKYKPFDKIYQAQAEQADSIVYTLTVDGMADTLGVLNAECATARATAPGYDSGNVQMFTFPDVDNWFDFFFELPYYRADYIFRDLPMVMNNHVTITLTNTGSVAKVGELPMGQSLDIGFVKYGVRTGLIDYSTKTADAFGNVTVTERAYSKRLTVDLLVKNTFIDQMQREFAKYRATPLLFYTGNLYESLADYGYLWSFENVISLPNFSVCSAEIQGLT
jgi:hypothetical protein